MSQHRNLIIGAPGELDDFPAVAVGNIAGLEGKSKSAERTRDRDAIGAVLKLVNGKSHKPKATPGFSRGPARKIPAVGTGLVAVGGLKMYVQRERKASNEPSK